MSNLRVLSDDACLKYCLLVSELDRRVWGPAESVTVPDGDHAWRVWIEYCFVSVALDGDELVGALCAFDTRIPDLHFLHKLFVAEQYRGQAIGSALMQRYAEELDRTEKRSMLTTDPRNDAMVTLAAKFQFTRVGFGVNYYCASKDRVLMGRPSPSSSTPDTRWWLFDEVIADSEGS